MVQTTNRFFDEVARLMNDAAGVAQGVRREFETLFRTQAERFLRDLDVVKREDFEAVKDMARIAREENEALKARVAALEAALAATRRHAGCAEWRHPPAAAFPGQASAAGPPDRLIRARSEPRRVLLRHSLFFSDLRRYKRRGRGLLQHPWRLHAEFPFSQQGLRRGSHSWRPSI